MVQIAWKGLMHKGCLDMHYSKEGRMPKWDIHWKVMRKILQAAVSTMGDLYRNCVRKLEACLRMLFIPTHLHFLSLSLFPLSLPLFVS